MCLRQGQRDKVTGWLGPSMMNTKPDAAEMEAESNRVLNTFSSSPQKTRIQIFTPRSLPPLLACSDCPT